VQIFPWDWAYDGAPGPSVPIRPPIASTDRPVTRAARRAAYWMKFMSSTTDPDGAAFHFTAYGTLSGVDHHRYTFEHDR
jgi:hypothetical protein